MLDSLVSWMTPFLVPPMNGLPLRTLPPEDPGYGIFATADGRQITLSIAGEDNMWAKLCDMLELPEWAGYNEEARSARAAEITPALRAAMARWPYDALYERLLAQGIAFGPVLRLDEVLGDAQQQVRGMAVGFGEGDARQTFVRQPNLFDGSGGAIARGVPALGEHNRELLCWRGAPERAAH